MRRLRRSGVLGTSSYSQLLFLPFAFITLFVGLGASWFMESGAKAALWGFTFVGISAITMLAMAEPVIEHLQVRRSQQMRQPVAAPHRATVGLGILFIVTAVASGVGGIGIPTAIAFAGSGSVLLVPSIRFRLSKWPRHD